MRSPSTQRLLIYRLGSLGDTVIALPCFHKIRDTFPNADITLLTNQPVMAKAAPLEAILGKEYFFDRVVAYPVGTRSAFVLTTIIRKIRALQIDTVINLTPARTKLSVFRDRLFFRAAGARQLIGFPSTPQDFGGIDPATGEHEWEAHKLARRLQALGPIPLAEEHYWDLRLTAAEQQEATQVLSSLSREAPIVAISIGAKMQVKDWGLANWLALIDRLKSSLPSWQLLMLGAAEEFVSSATLLHAWNGPSLNLCGKTSPRVSAAVLQRTKLYIGHDSGPMHLAACVGVPCVGIFAARNLPRQWYPRGATNQIIYHHVDCAGCNLDTCIAQQKRCILSITVEEVQQAVMTIVRSQSHHAFLSS